MASTNEFGPDSGGRVKVHCTRYLTLVYYYVHTMELNSFKKIINNNVIFRV